MSRLFLVLLGVPGLVFANASPGAAQDDRQAGASKAADRAAPLVRRLPGLDDSGQILLPNQWSLRPAGKQIKLGDFPVQIVLHPSEPWAAIVHCGYGEHEIIVVDLKRQRVVSRTTLEQSFYGLCFDPEGKRLFASGAEHEVVHQFDFAGGYLSEHRELPVGRPDETFVPTGITCDADGRTLYVANAWGHTLCLLPIDDPSKRRHVSMGRDSYPYASLATTDGKRLYVSLWGQAAVALLNSETLEVDARWPTESHPTELALSPDGRRLFVACANSNTVTVLDTANGEPMEVIASALHPQAPSGSTPNSLALAANGNVLLIANADNNNLAMFNVSQPGRSQSMGFIPVGWYPTSVRYGPDNRIYVANGKGLMSLPNPRGPQPLNDPPQTVRQYIGGLFRGTLSVIEAPSPADMARYTEQAYRASPLKADASPVAAPAEENNPVPSRLGDPSPIKYCLYIVKENRTYDQVFGDVPDGNGDAELCIFPERVTPNHHALARQFVLLDNFYVESEVSADGHEWTMGAYASDFVEKTWPLVYRGGKDKLKYPSEGATFMATPAGGYIWDRCLEAGVSYRSYGEFIDNGLTADDPGTAAVKALEGHFDPLFRSYDLDYLDIKRAERFIEELKGFERAGEMPQFIVLRLPNDHTYGLSAGKRTPTAMVADNDLALGRLVEAVTQSKFWPQTAIFVVEDDAQNGSDHVDAHRTVALVISPYTRRNCVDSTMYSTASMLRTMELILGLQPMSQFDAAARPMYASFQAEPDTSGYRHLPSNVDLEERNPQQGWGAEQSAQLDFSREDAADDLLLNALVWKSVRGPDSRMPPPVRASFVFVHGEEEEGAER
ncbi:MAG: bifunctional YncE family protein/alkaline phosphatase family protein [Pirellulales bacterium]